MAIYPDLTGKHIIITGASGDMGIEMCELYLNADCHVYAIYNSDSSGINNLKNRHLNGRLLFPLQCNLTKKENVEEVVKEIEKETPKIDVLINNAGIYKDNLFSSMTDEEFRLVIETNLYGMWYMTKSTLPLLRQSDSATVINVSSVAGIASSFGQINYSAAKAGIIGFTRTLAVEYAAKGIRVNAIAPGMIESKMVKKISRDKVRQAIALIPLKRLGKPDEVASAVAFLSSSSSAYIVGQTLIIDGGLVMR